MDYKFQRKRIDNIFQERMLEELEKAAKHFNYIEFGRRDFARVADISDNVLRRYFGSWRKSLEALRGRLKEKGLNLASRPHAPQQIYSDKEVFKEMERVLQKSGQRPSRMEWEVSDSKISYGTLQRRFGGWTNACLKFIEYKMGGEILANDFVITNDEVSGNKRTEYKREISRDVPLGLRLKILNRDNFRCIFCGKSPATDFGTKLHIDHITPFSKGGKSVLENLQTLCVECNLGKGNRHLE